MATNAFKSLYNFKKQHSLDHPPPPSTTTTKYSFFLKPTTSTTTTTSLSLSNSTTFAASSATYSTPITDTSTTQDTQFELLQQHLSSKNFREADEETRRLLIVLAGEAAEKRGYVFFSEVQFISSDDLKTIDELWRKYSDNKFGYSVQKKIWKKMKKDFTSFFIKVAWMKKLESSEVEQYNYRAFPTEFIWENDENTPEGHLPLTNALRGTRLLQNIFTHPAFEDDDEEDEEEEIGTEENGNGNKLLSKKLFKTNYTF
ncbi:hypothetical protein ACJIZ3_018024 [Penstemon smallii]|uniref:GUN4-like domain-containing protein n=1 Tax=Penstemon smallii TaxID=265156 RepID=A0ABD3SYJ6_9LAMI